MTALPDGLPTIENLDLEMLRLPIQDMGFPDGAWCATEPFGTLFVWGYDKVKAVLSDPVFAVPEIEELSFGAVTEGPAADWARLSPSFRDGVEHRRIRSTATKAFSPTVIHSLGPMIESRAKELVAGLPVDREFDLVERLSQKLPMAVFGSVLGVDDDRLLKIAPDVHAMTRLFTWSSGEWKDRIEQAVDTLYEIIDSVRENPTETVTGIEAAGLPDEGVRHLLTQLLVGGWETTGAQIANMVWVLTADGHWDTFKTFGAEGQYRQIALETARYKPATVAAARICRQDTDLFGVTVPAGTWVALALGWSARDPEIFNDPDVWNPGRYDDPTCPDPLAFGMSRHRCVGERLAYLELEAIARAVDTAGPPRGWELTDHVEWADKDRPIQPLALRVTVR